MAKLKITKVTPQTIQIQPIEIHHTNDFALATTDKKGSGANLAYGLTIDSSSTWSVSDSTLTIK